MSSTVEFDRIVGKIAGAIYADISRRFPCPPLMLVPALTFKVKKALEQAVNMWALSQNQKVELAKEIQVSIIPLLFSYDVDPEIIEQITPAIELAALRALMEAA
jgi:hypothetical protein